MQHNRPTRRERATGSKGRRKRGQTHHSETGGCAETGQRDCTTLSLGFAVKSMLSMTPQCVHSNLLVHCCPQPVALSSSRLRCPAASGLLFGLALSASLEALLEPRKISLRTFHQCDGNHLFCCIYLPRARPHTLSLFPKSFANSHINLPPIPENPN